MKAYKIKNAEGLFSKGGTNPTFTKRGKTWGSLGAVKLHLRFFCSDGGSEIINGKYTWYKRWKNQIPNEWIVVELSEEGIKEYSAKELYPKTEEKDEK